MTLHVGRYSHNNVYLLTYALDINECNLGEDDCHAQATCTDTTGGFDCACNSGYSGDGKSCTGN